MRIHFTTATKILGATLAALSLFASGYVAGQNKFGQPKTERAVLLEGRHEADYPFVQEHRLAPFDGFLDIRAGRVDQCAQVVEDGFGKIGRAGNIRVHATVLFRFGRHTLPPKISIPTTFDKQNVGWQEFT